MVSRDSVTVFEWCSDPAVLLHSALKLVDVRRFERNYPWLLLVLAVLLAPAILTVLVAGLVAILAGAVGGASIGALLSDVTLMFAITVLLVLAEFALLASFVRSILGRAAFPTSDRLAGLFGRFETVFPPLRYLSPSDRFAPTVEERKRTVKRRYVDGELTEREFEREMAALLAEADPESAAGDHHDSLEALDSTPERRERVRDSLHPGTSRRERPRDAERE